MSNTPTPLHCQKQAVSIALEIATEALPGRIAQNKMTQDMADKVLAWLEASLVTLDKADRGVDVRTDLLKWQG